MELLAAAIAANLILLWGGIAVFLRLVPAPTPRHFLGLGAYATVVVGTILGLVLFTLQERQREHRAELARQMETVTHRLDELGTRLVQQLEEKADLTASEFEIRARLQHEEEGHRRTQEELAQRDQALVVQEQRSREYQAQVDRQVQERFQHEEQRYQQLGSGLERQQALLENLQRQLAGLQQGLAQALAGQADLERQQAGMGPRIEGLGAAQQRQSQQLQDLQAQLAVLNRISSAVDSLYHWKKK
ncbi:MAG: hypothetical protein IT369_12380 [Candidatus Latescibacteria bacterium]|nr:hypothetical protein [Candidatus Latescibacterota bacterium]